MKQLRAETLRDIQRTILERLNEEGLDGQDV
jgi:hypothetical protein